LAHRKVKKGKHRQSFRWLLLFALIPTVLVGGAVYWKINQSPTPQSAQQAYGTAVYTVVPGDSLLAIAARYRVSTDAIMAANGITNPNLVVIGTRLRIPIPSASAPSGVPDVSPEVQRRISSYARLYGIPPAFALAVAWQESGFNQTMVSHTGAIGVMQVEPDTGVTVSNLLGRSLNLHNVDDNIQAGVYLLARLVSTYNGNHRLAAAAYYQGARSVSRDGMYPDTVQYVGNVMALEARFGG
jgi:N-acetylmuramoyl-L-alanine amidase